MVDIDDLFGNEIDDLKKQVKSEEEISKWSTKDDFTELDRGVYLLKKGYEMQKLSVIQHLDRYMKEAQANENLLVLIIQSLEDWDNKMQIQCAQNFIKPLKNNLVNESNLRLLLKLAITIVLNEDNIENEELVDSWIEVLENVVGRVSLSQVSQIALPPVIELPKLQNPLAKRKRGIRLITKMAKNVGEEGLQKEPLFLKCICSFVNDNNFKIRLDGVNFYREYLLANSEKLIGTDQFENVYLPELIDLLDDEEPLVKIEAIEGLVHVLEHLDQQSIEQEFIPQVTPLLDVHINADEVLQKMARLCGNIIYKLQNKKFDKDVQMEFLQFFYHICEDKDPILRKNAVYNLPCYYQIYNKSDDLEDIGINFIELYSRFYEDEEIEHKQIVAASLHEAFKIAGQDEDTTQLRQLALQIFEETQKDIIMAFNKNFDQVIATFVNDYWVQVTKGESPKNANDEMGTTASTVKVDSKNKDQLDWKHSNTAESSKHLNYKESSFKVKRASNDGEVIRTNSKKAGLKRKKTMGVEDMIKTKEVDSASANNGPYIILPEYTREQCYSELLPKVLQYDENLKNNIGLWREHANFLNKFSENLNVFHQPELHDLFAETLFNHIMQGNHLIRKSAIKCLVKMLCYQQSAHRREELVQMILTNLAEATAFSLRTTFIHFCEYGISHFTREFFKQNFLDTYFIMGDDRVSQVRMEFSKAAVKIKLYLDYNSDLSMKLVEQLNKLRNDDNPDVAEVTEQADFEMFQLRKKHKENDLNALEKQLLKREAELTQRMNKEEEERKRREEEAEETKYDFGSFLVDKKSKKGKTGQVRKGNPSTTKLDGGRSSMPLQKGLSSTNNKIGITDKQPQKRKMNGTQKRNSSALPNTADIPQMKLDRDRKSSVMLPQSSSILDKNQQPIGGYENYKKYQILVSNVGKDSNEQSQRAVGVRSHSLIQQDKKPIKKSYTLTDKQLSKPQSKSRQTGRQQSAERDKNSYHIGAQKKK